MHKSDIIPESTKVRFDVVSREPTRFPFVRDLSSGLHFLVFHGLLHFSSSKTRRHGFGGLYAALQISVKLTHLLS